MDPDSDLLAEFGFNEYGSETLVNISYRELASLLVYLVMASSTLLVRAWPR